MHYLLCPFHPVPKADNGGCALLTPGWIHPRRKLDSSVIIIGRKGTVLLEEEGESLEVVPNRLILLTAGKLHQGVKALEAHASYYWFHFTLPQAPETFSQDEIAPILSNPMVTQQRLAEAALIPQRLDLMDADKVTLLFRELLNEQERPCYTNWKLQIMFQSLLITITNETINSYQPPENLSAGSSLVYAIVTDINAHLTNPNLSVKSIASDLRHNPDYIGRQFRTVMGLPIGEYILKQRMKLAEQLLQDSHETVINIATKCGFSSVRHFLRQFRKERGMTPSELRRRYLAMHINIQ
ncbi:MAG TPA: AraC family transcriptional regulator [Bacillota bacterium]|nr:AraC family transcriptional regulator [Bacillota bacterium]